MAARAARAPLNVDHSKAEQSASEENPGTEEPKKTAVDAYVNLPSNVTPKEEWRHTQNSWYSTGMIEIPSSELTEDRKGSGSFVLKNPVVVDLDEEAGTKIYYTRIAWVGGRWHLDGVVTEQVKNFCVASIQDKTETKVYGSEAGVTAKWDGWFNFTPDELSALNEAINESGVDLPRGYNWNFLKNDNRLPPVPESVKKAATKILQRKGWKAGDDAIEWSFGYDGSDGWHLNGVVNGDNAKKQENVSIVVSDPTGQVYLATNKAAGNGYWHDITHGAFILL